MKLTSREKQQIQRVFMGAFVDGPSRRGVRILRRALHHIIDGWDPKDPGRSTGRYDPEGAYMRRRRRSKVRFTTAAELRNERAVLANLILDAGLQGKLILWRASEYLRKGELQSPGATTGYNFTNAMRAALRRDSHFEEHFRRAQ